MSEEGKNVDELINLSKQKGKADVGLLLQLLKGAVELLFPEGKLSMCKDGSMKIHVDSINNEQLMALGAGHEGVNISLKRSGYGITILFELKK